MSSSNPVRPVPTVVALAALALFAPSMACTHTSSLSASALAVSIHFPSRADPIPVPGTLSIDVETTNGLDYRMETVTESGHPPRTVTKVNGEAFEVVGDELHIGARRYGPLAAGQVVRVTKDGVLVDGKRVEPR
ncbi:MAG: hypothetical protein HZA53_13405 [Planctomycetes bacterium]|nr:hypothetical protein [Planctomycetota bacterium]